MSIGLIGVEKQEFDSEVKHVYQGMQTLRSTVTVRNGVVGDTYNFRRMSKGLANQKAIQSLVTPMNVGHALIACDLHDWLAPEYTDIFAAQTVNFDEKVELATTIGKALGRRDDQMVIEALEDLTYAADATAVADETEGRYEDFGGDRFISSTLQFVRSYYNSIECFDDIYCVCGASAIDNLLGEEKATSADYVRNKVLDTGKLDSHLGFTFKIIGDRTGEGGITQTDATNHFAYFYPKAAVGMAVGLDIRTSIDWVPERTSWLCNGLLKAGAVVRDPNAIFKCQYDPA